jgi:hypothetical protein
MFLLLRDLPSLWHRHLLCLHKIYVVALNCHGRCIDAIRHSSIATRADVDATAAPAADAYAVATAAADDDCTTTTTAAAATSSSTSHNGSIQVTTRSAQVRVPGLH